MSESNPNAARRRAPLLPLLLLAPALVAQGLRAEALRPGASTRLTGGGGFSGAPISISVQNADLQDVLRLIARTAGLNLIVDEDLSGRSVTMDLVEVPWDQALDVVLRSQGLGAEWNRNVLQVAPTEALVRENQQAAELRELRERSGGLVAVARRLSYADAAEVEPIVRAHLSPDGRLSVDRRTNTLIIQDRPEVVRRIAGLLELSDGAVAPRDSGEALVTRSAAESLGASHVSASTERQVLASWNGWLLDCDESFVRRLEPEGRVEQALNGTPSVMARLELDDPALELAKLQLGRLSEQGRLRVRSSHPVALPPGGSASIELGPLGLPQDGAGTALLDLGLERDGGRFVLTFRARRSSGARLPLAWHGATDSGWVVELRPAPGEPWRVLLLVPAD